MLQKLLFESSIDKSQNKSSHHNIILSSSSKFNIFLISQKILYHKYSKFEYSFSLFCTNNLIFNEKCRIVARFKDFLVLDDSTEFLRRFYSKKELKTRLKKIFNFYDSYCKIFPNYMILKKSQFLYRNIRKKQKMIDAFNEIKKEEEENRKHLKLGLVDENLKNKEKNVVFTKKIQESIDRYHPSVSNLLSNTFMSDINNINNEFNNDKNMFSISLNSQRPLNFLEFDKYFIPYKNSFLENDKNLNDNTINSQNSIFKIVQILNNNNITDINNPFNNKDKNNNNNNNLYNKINKIEYKNHISQFNSKKTIKNNNNINNNNNKHNTKKLLNNNNYHNNKYNTINSNSNKNININKISNINNNSNNKKQKQENKENKDNKENNININNKRKFISHKQTVSVPLASNMLNNNDNIIEEKNTIKIINNINNIIINDDKNKTINDGMIININNNYFQLKNPKKINNKIIKRVKSKEDQKKEQSKDKNIFKVKGEKDEQIPHFKIFREKRTYTSYNTQNNVKNNNKFLINEIQSPNRKKEINNNNNNNLDNKKNNKIINTNNYYSNINNNYKQNNIYRNNNKYQNDNKKNYKRLIESKTLNNNSHTNTNNNKNITEINNNYKNMLGNRLKISMNKNKEKPKLEGLESIDIKKMSINRKIVNNYLTTTQKKKSYQGRFQGQESTYLNTYSNNNNNSNNNTNKKYNDISEKIEVLNIYNTIQNKNNPIKFKLNKKNIIRKTKTNSIQINNKKEFLSSFHLTKEKIPGTNIEIDIINIEDNNNNNNIKYHKKSIKKFLNNKTQSNSEAELIKDMNNKNNNLNTFISKSLKKNKFKSNNDKKTNNNNDNINNNEIKKLNVKEMKEKYHKLLRGNKVTHGSYDTTNRLHLLKKFRGLNNVIGNVTNTINSTITANKNKRSPLIKKSILSPSDRVQNTVGSFIKTPIKNKLNINNKETIDNNNNNNVINGNRFHLINKKNKQIDTNNKKMKFIKK